MGRPPLSEQDNKKNKITLINVTKELIDLEGFSNVSVRSISRASGINSATVYRYFQDVDELILYASLDILKEYNLHLYNIQTDIPESAYLEDWKLFANVAFDNASTIYNLFFGRHSGDISCIIKDYFELFPQVKVAEAGSFSNLMYMGGISERNFLVLRPVLEGRKSEEEISVINELTVAYFKTLLEEKAANPQLENDDLTEKMLKACKVLLS